MKRFTMLVSGLLLGTLTFGAVAQTTPTFDATVGVQSRSDFRGQEYSSDAVPMVGAKVSDLGVTGLYVSGDFAKTGNSFPLNNGSPVESSLAVGYVFSPVTDLSLDVSARQVYNAQEYLVNRNGSLVAGNYSEFNVKASYNVMFAEVGQAFGQNQNTYAKVGVSVPLLSDRLHVGAAVSGYHYQNSVGTQNQYNNSEVFASYSLIKNLNVYGKYSFGGHGNVADLGRGGYTGSVLDNYGIVGVSYKF